MKRTTGRPKHLLLVLSLFMVACVGPQPDVRNGPTRNVLLLIADDQGLDLGCYGNTVIQTPHQDKLASQGVRFTHAFSTAASCSTNRSVILTGLYNHTNGPIRTLPPDTIIFIPCLGSRPCPTSSRKKDTAPGSLANSMLHRRNSTPSISKLTERS